MSNIPLDSIIQLYNFSTGRRLYTFQRVLVEATTLSLDSIKTLVQEAIVHDEATYALEQKWAVQRRTGKLSEKQVKAQNRLQKMDILVDRCLSGLRDGALSAVAGADEEEKDLVGDAETLIDGLFPLGVGVITKKKYPEELVAVQAIVVKLKDAKLAPIVTRLGLDSQAKRLEQLALKYEEAMQGVEDLAFGELREARALGQGYLLRIVAKVMGLFDEPAGESAQKRGQLLGPVMEQNAKIGEHMRARRSAPDVDPKTGEEQVEEIVTAKPENG